jgi:hypothetical protein
MGPGKLTPRMGGAFRPDDATARAGESTGVARLLHISDLVPDHRAYGGGKNCSSNAAFGGASHSIASARLAMSSYYRTATWTYAFVARGAGYGEASRPAASLFRT